MKAKREWRSSPRSLTLSTKRIIRTTWLIFGTSSPRTSKSSQFRILWKASPRSAKKMPLRPMMLVGKTTSTQTSLKVAIRPSWTRMVTKFHRSTKWNSMVYSNQCKTKSYPNWLLRDRLVLSNSISMTQYRAEAITTSRMKRRLRRRKLPSHLKWLLKNQKKRRSKNKISLRSVALLSSQPRKTK